MLFNGCAGPVPFLEDSLMASHKPRDIYQEVTDRIIKVIFEKPYPKSWQNVLSCHYRIERP